MNFLSDLILDGQLYLTSGTTVDNTTLNSLFIASNNQVVKRVIGDMSFETTTNYFTKTASDNRFLQTVGLSLPAIFNVTGSPATPSGSTLTATFVSQTKNTILAAPDNFNGTPSFRALTANDIPSLGGLYLPLSGGTLIGNLIGTTATFSGTVTTPKILIGSGAFLTNSYFRIGQSVNAHTQANIQNTNTGTLASSDWVATANNGTDTTNFINFGINNSTNADPAWTMGGANDGYAFVNGGHFTIGTQSAKDIKFFTGGVMATNEKMRIFNSGNVAIGSTTDGGYKLDVNGTARIQSSLIVTPLAGTGKRYITADNTGILSAATFPTTLAGYGITDNVAIINDSLINTGNTWSSTKINQEIQNGTNVSSVVNYIGVSGETSFTDINLVGKSLALVTRSGIGYQVITSGVPTEQQVNFNSATGQVTFINGIYTGEPISILFIGAAGITTGSYLPLAGGTLTGAVKGLDAAANNEFVTLGQADTKYVSQSGLTTSFVSTGRTLTINGTAFDLSANRSWTIPTGTGTVTSVGISVANGITVGSTPITTSGTISLGLGAITPTSVVSTGSIGGTTGSFTGTVTAPTFSGTLSGNATSATNLAGGSLGLIPYQSAANTTLFLAAGTAKQVLVSNGIAAPSWATLDMTYVPDSAFKKTAIVATTVNITLSAVQTIDGIPVVAGDRVLVKNQTSSPTNGIYTVAAGAWTRVLDADASSEIGSAVVAIDSGTVNGGKLFTTLFKTTDTLGTTNMLWYEVIDSDTVQTLTNKTEVNPTITSLAADGAATTGVFLNGSNKLVTRALGSNAFNSTAFTTNTGTVTSIGMTVPTGLSIGGSPITTSGTLALTLQAGYSIPTTSSQTNWDTAFTNNHTHTNKAFLDTITSNATILLNVTGNAATATNVAWSGITSKPTTLAGYGITDAVPSGRTITINGTTLDLSANRSWTISGGASGGTGSVTSVDMTVPTGLSVVGNPITTSGTLAVSFQAGYSIPTIAKQTFWDTNYLPLSGGTLTGAVTTNSQITSTNKILIGTGTFLSNSFFRIGQSVNAHTQGNIQNTNTGTLASSDWVATANNGTDTTNFINIGINNSTNADPAWTMAGANDGYAFVNGGHFVIGTQTASKDIKFFTGGVMAVNEKMKLVGASGNLLIGTTTDSTYKLDVAGTGRFTGTVTVPTLTSTNDLTVNTIRVGVGAVATTGSAALGFNTLNAVTNTTAYAVAIGFSALKSLTTGTNNVAIGYGSQFTHLIANNNTSIGWMTLNAFNGSGSTNNTVLGYASGRYLTTGNNNTLIGSQTGNNAAFLTVSGMVALGFQAGQNETTNDKLYIDNSNTSSPLIYGDFATHNIVLNGNLAVTGLTGSGTRMVVTDATGNLSSQAIPSGGGGGYNISLKTANYSEMALTGTAIIQADTTTASFAVTLPTAVGNNAMIIVKKVAGTNPLTINTTSSQTIDGGLTAILNNVYESITLVSNNSNWLII